MTPPLTSSPLSSAASPGGKSPLKDLIEAQRSSLHRSSTSKLPSHGQRLGPLFFVNVRIGFPSFGPCILMQSYPPSLLDRILQEDWARAAKEGPRILMNLRVDFWAHGPRLGPLFFVNIRIGFLSFRPCILMQSYPSSLLDRRLQEDWARAAKEGSRLLMYLRVDFWAHGPRLGPLFFVNIRIVFPSFRPCILTILVV